MGSINDFPERHSNHDIGGLAEVALVNAIDAEKLFLVQQKDKHDYGIDITLEARGNGSVTNLWVHVQLKGIESAASAVGSVAVQVARKNLNYLLMQPDSVYVCFHVPTGRLLAKPSQDVFRDYEHRGGNWQDQAELTVRLSVPFDARFQQRLHARVPARGHATRDRRLDWIPSPRNRGWLGSWSRVAVAEECAATRERPLHLTKASGLTRNGGLTAPRTAPPCDC